MLFISQLIQLSLPRREKILAKAANVPPTPCSKCEKKTNHTHTEINEIIQFIQTHAEHKVSILRECLKNCSIPII